MSIHDFKDTSKFEHADVFIGDVRITFQSFQDIMRYTDEDIGKPRDKSFLKEMLDQYNIIEDRTSKGYHNEFLKIDLEPEETSPDIFLLNSANAYSLFLLSVEVCSIK